MHYTDESQIVDEYGWRFPPEPGDTVDLGGEWVATLTEAGIKCDCGKYVLCPLNTQEKK